MPRKGTDWVAGFQNVSEFITQGNIGKDGEKQNPSYIADSNIKWCNHLGKQLGGFLKS